MSTPKGNNPRPHGVKAEKQSLYWISLFTGIPELQNGSVEQACEKMVEWWQYSAERISRQIPELPEDFRTTRIWRELKTVDNYFVRLKPVFSALQSGTHNMEEAIVQLRHIFSDEEQRLITWKKSLDNLQGLILWLPAFSHAREYVLAAFPLGIEYPDNLCSSLIQSIRDPYPFMDSGTRDSFEKKFLEFKKCYMENYYSLHEEMRNITRDKKREESKIDPVALRNLELLSGIYYSDQSYLNRVNILARWIQRNQCTLPVIRILERYPRCYCNFNPSSIRQPIGPVNQINEIIREGIEYYRGALRQSRTLIIKEIEAEKPEDETSKQIGTLLGKGAMISLKEPTIETINRVVRANPGYFQNRFRP